VNEDVDLVHFAPTIETKQISINKNIKEPR